MRYDRNTQKWVFGSDLVQHTVDIYEDLRVEVSVEIFAGNYCAVFVVVEGHTSRQNKILVESIKSLRPMDQVELIT